MDLYTVLWIYKNFIYVQKKIEIKPQKFAFEVLDILSNDINCLLLN